MICEPFDERCQKTGRSGIYPTSQWFKEMHDAGIKPWGIHEDGYYPDGMQRLSFRNGVELYRRAPDRFCTFSWFGLRCQIPSCLGTVE